MVRPGEVSKLVIGIIPNKAAMQARVRLRVAFLFLEGNGHHALRTFVEFRTGRGDLTDSRVFF